MNSAPIEPLISTSDLDKIDVRFGTISLSRTWRIRRRLSAVSGGTKHDLGRSF
jgi:hypothetical protein